MTATVPTPDELAEILVTMLVGAAGGTARKWRVALGKVEKLPTWQHIRSNWIVHPMGSAADLATIAKAVEIVRAAHPYVAP